MRLHLDGKNYCMYVRRVFKKITCTAYFSSTRKTVPKDASFRSRSLMNRKKRTQHLDRRINLGFLSQAISRHGCCAGCILLDFHPVLLLHAIDKKNALGFFLEGFKLVLCAYSPKNKKNYHTYLQCRKNFKFMFILYYIMSYEKFEKFSKYSGKASF